MDAVEFLKEFNRMCKAQSECDMCPFDEYGCTYLSINGLSEECAVSIVEKWSKNHKQKTIMDDFLEKYPNAHMLTDCGEEYPRACALYIGYLDKCPRMDGQMLFTCTDCWHTRLSESLLGKQN